MIDIQDLNKQHIEQIMEIEKSCFSVPWSKQSFIEELSNPLAKYLVALEGDEVIGYIGMWFIVDEVHITNIAVKPTKRRRGIGDLILREAIGWAEEQQCVAMTLEVRESNLAAIHLYEKYDFKKAARRKNYYANPTEDAVIMWKSL